MSDKKTDMSVEEKQINKYDLGQIVYIARYGNKKCIKCNGTGEQSKSLYFKDIPAMCNSCLGSGSELIINDKNNRKYKGEKVKEPFIMPFIINDISIIIKKYRIPNCENIKTASSKQITYSVLISYPDDDFSFKPEYELFKEEIKLLEHEICLNEKDAITALKEND